MARVSIEPIKRDTHLSNSIKYITKDNKTNDGLYIDSYYCTPKYAVKDFAFTREKEVIKKGNNLAWHIYQSFSPNDKVTPEKALEIGKELMKRMYPDYQYVIATHIDREHIHNHIILCSVNFKDYHKLNSNKTSLAKLQNISDDLCRENGLSIINRKERPLRVQLRNTIDDAINASNDFSDFINYMQNAGYNIKLGKHISFKNDDMQRFFRSSTIGLDYTEAGIKHRIESLNKEPRFHRRNKYDDKVIAKSKRKILRAEMDASLKKAKTYEEFLEDMRRKNFEVKEGKHLAFKGENQERFIRSESLGYHYTEEVLRFRFEFREEYEEMMAKKIGRVIDPTDFDGPMANWAAGENMNTKIRASNWIQENITNGDWLGASVEFAFFLDKYYEEKNNINAQNKKVENINAQMREVVKAIKAIETYWTYKPLVKQYHNDDLQSISATERADAIKTYNSNINKYNYSIRVMEAAKEQLGTISLTELNSTLDKLKSLKRSEQAQLTRMKLNFETYEDIKYNYETEQHRGGYGISEEYAYAKLNEALAKRKKQLDRKEKIKGIFGLNK